MTIPPRFLLPLALAAFCPRAGAAVPPPEKLLPKDTVLVITAPDWGKAAVFWSNTPYAKLWQDPALKPFKDKFIDKFTTTLVKPLEQNLGIKFSDYQGLAQGQMTFALVPITPKNKSDIPLAAILLLDTKDHAGQLKTNLAWVLKKWADAGKPMKAQKIREMDFTTLFVSPDDLSRSKMFPGVKPPGPSDADADAAKAATNKFEITVGQSDSLLVVSSSTEAIDKVLSLQAGGLVPPLEESPAFAADYAPRLRQSPFYVWLSAKNLMDLFTKATAAAGDDAAPSPFHLDTLLAATGLGNINSVSFSIQPSPEGDCAQLFIAVPEEKRPALLKMFAADAKDSAPPSFVPADAVKFLRWRLNLARSWKSMETMLNDYLPPQIMAQINMVLGMAGKDKDEHYDLKSELLNNLGDDIITYSKAPKGNTLADLKSAPTLYLLGSPNPDKLAAALKVLLAIPFPGSPIADREFLGRKIFTAGPPPAEGNAPALGGVSFSASGGYVALSGDASFVEEYLRSSDSNTKALIDMPGLADAAQKVGGMGTGLFGYDNQAQTMRPAFEIMRKQPFTLQDVLGAPLPPDLTEQLESYRQWADFTLLPPFDTVAKYFYFSIYAGGFTPDGFALKAFMPTPPQLRQ